MTFTQTDKRQTHMHIHNTYMCTHLPLGKTANRLISQGAFLLLMKISLLPCLCLKEMQPVPVKEDMVFVQYLMDMEAWVCRCICKPLSGKACNGTVWTADWENYIEFGCDERGVTASHVLLSLDEFRVAFKNWFDRNEEESPSQWRVFLAWHICLV